MGRSSEATSSKSWSEEEKTAVGGGNRRNPTERTYCAAGYCDAGAHTGGGVSNCTGTGTGGFKKKAQAALLLYKGLHIHGNYPLQVSTSREPFFDHRTLRRWETYGAPHTPSPEQQEQNRLSALWAGLRKIPDVEILRLPSSPKSIDELKNLARKQKILTMQKMDLQRKYTSASNVLKRDKTIPRERKNADEAAAIAFLAANRPGESVAGAI